MAGRNWGRVLAWAVAVVGCLSTLAIAGAIVLIKTYREPTAHSSGGDRPAFLGLQPEINEDYPAQVPEFWTWLRSRTPEPPEQRRWLAVVTDATRQGYVLVIRTGLPVTGSSFDTAITICTAALEFVRAKPELGLRSATVTAADHTVLAAGERACRASVIR